MYGTIRRIGRLALLSVSFPFIAGCGGGGAAGLLGSLIGGSSLASGLTAGLESLFGVGGGSGDTSISTITTLTDRGVLELAQIHNPEPATMFLLGSGFVAMGYIKKSFQKR